MSMNTMSNELFILVHFIVLKSDIDNVYKSNTETNHREILCAIWL